MSLIDSARRAEILDFYDGYTNAFQAAYERFAASSGGPPDPTDALPYYHKPCLFITPAGVEAYPTEADLARHFSSIMLDMQAHRYRRTGLGPIHLTAFSPSCVLLSLVITRYDLDEQQYDEYGVTYTVARTNGAWRVVIVNTHPTEGILATDD